jgi:shikimate kinase
MRTFKQHLIEGIHDTGRFKAVFVCGVPFAGKTTVGEKISSGAVAPRLVNTDYAFEYFVNKNGGFGDSHKEEHWDAHGESAQRMTSERLALYVNSMLPLMVDSTSSNPSSVVRRRGILQSLGYDVSMVWVEASPATIRARFESGVRDRSVSPEFLDRVLADATANRKFFNKEFPDFYIVDNDDVENNDDILIAAYKRAYKFFTDSIHNPIGQRFEETLLSTGGKYLSPELMGMDKIKARLAAWY